MLIIANAWAIDLNAESELQLVVKCLSRGGGGDESLTHPNITKASRAQLALELQRVPGDLPSIFP